MIYNFNEPISRKNTNSYKWDVSDKENFLPMFVADMDFRTSPKIIEALKKRVEHGIFGYVKVPESYYNSLIDWFLRKHNWQMQRENIIYTSGVVPAISAIIKAVTNPGDKVLIQSPVYNCFFSSIRNNGCLIEYNLLKNINNRYEIDYQDFEQKISDPKVKVFLLCNPHNPTGRVFSKEELTKMGEICLKHNVFVISDEIHCELTFPEKKYTPFASICEEFAQNSAVCTSPSKDFNIAGLQIANISAPDKNIRQKIDRAININEVCDVNPFGVEALQAAYNFGEDWLKQLNEYLYNNYLYLKQFFNTELPQFSVAESEGTYLAWIDCNSLKMSGEEICQNLYKEENLLFNSGEMYGLGGEGFVRINFACPRFRLEDGLTRMKNWVKRL